MYTYNSESVTRNVSILKNYIDTALARVILNELCVKRNNIIYIKRTRWPHGCAIFSLQTHDMANLSSVWSVYCVVRFNIRLKGRIIIIKGEKVVIYV